MKKIKFTLFLICLFTTSCSHFEEVAINPNSKAKFEFAVFGFIAPADSVFITIKSITNVGEVIKSNATALTKIQNVRIIDLETNQSIDLVSNNSLGIYSASQRNFPVLINHNYKLIIKVLDALDIIAETITIPYR